MLGFDKRGERLRLNPCIPTTWPRFRIEYRYGTSVYTIDVENPAGVSNGVASLTVDGVVSTDGCVHLLDDGALHAVTIVLGPVADPTEASQ